MNAESFAEYLKNPSKLYQLNYQELKSLALQYPYCQNLQWLLLHKSGIDHHRDFEHNLEKTAAGSLDRTLLFQQIKTVLDQEKPTETLRLDEVLELQDLSKLRLSKEPLPREEKVQQTSQNKEIPVDPIVTKSDFKEEEEEELDFSLEIPPEKTTELSEEPGSEDTVEKPAMQEQEEQLVPEENSEVEWEISNLESADAEEEVETQVDTEHYPTTERAVNIQNPSLPETYAGEDPIEHTEGPLPKSAFDSWSKYEPPQLNIKTGKKESPKPHKEKDVAKMVEQSVQEKEGLVSETLAAILARQGQTEKAIKMYERLILLFPEKSAYFAAQISKLKRP